MFYLQQVVQIKKNNCQKPKGEATAQVAQIFFKGGGAWPKWPNGKYATVNAHCYHSHDSTMLCCILSNKLCRKPHGEGLKYTKKLKNRPTSYCNTQSRARVKRTASVVLVTAAAKTDDKQ